MYPYAPWSGLNQTVSSESRILHSLADNFKESDKISQHWQFQHRYLFFCQVCRKEESMHWASSEKKKYIPFTCSRATEQARNKFYSSWYALASHFGHGYLLNYSDARSSLTFTSSENNYTWSPPQLSSIVANVCPRSSEWFPAQEKNGRTHSIKLQSFVSSGWLTVWDQLAIC